MEVMSDLCRYENTGFRSDALDALLDAIRATHANGGVLFAQFRAVDVDDRARWFAAGSSIYWTNEVFRSLFDSPAVRSALPELLIPEPYPITEPPQFFESPTGTLSLAGELASSLIRGGAYVRFPGSVAEASQLVSGALVDVVGDRHEQFRVFQSVAPWTPWFFDIAWDQTWILADYERLQVSVLCKTDTD
jgi:hypothetical protein